MKRFTKMLALGLAAVLTFGMSVQAAPSTNTADFDKVEGVDFTSYTESELDAVKANAEVKKDVNNAAIVAAFEMNVGADFKKEVTVKVSGVNRGDVCYAYKYKDAALTKLVAKIELSTGEGTVTFVPIEGCYYVIANEGKAAGSGSSSSSSPSSSASGSAASSPKTGETVPAAGVMALVLMAGAVVCAKKVRYNR